MLRGVGGGRGREGKDNGWGLVSEVFCSGRKEVSGW